MKKWILTLAKWAWALAVIGFVAYFVYSNLDEIRDAYRRISYLHILLAFGCILAAKMLLPAFMYLTLFNVGKPISLCACYRIYNITQLGKYIPGNIWHLVGKGAAYKNMGFSLGNIRDALLIENLWLVGSALAYGLVVLLLFEFDLFLHFAILYRNYLFLFLLIIPAGLYLLRRFGRINPGTFLPTSKPNAAIILIQCLVWTLLGLGFAVLALPMISDISVLPMILGLHAVAYSIGFVTPFAPAGIGVREGILALGLSSFASLDIILLASLANRLLYLLVELFLAVCVTPLCSSSTRQKKVA